MAIDHDRRRRDIAEIAVDLIASEGLEAATIRRIAAEAGFSTTAITYYFADKRALLLWTFQLLEEVGDSYYAQARAHTPDDTMEALLTLVPWCPANIRRWKAYLAFWDQASRDPELGELMVGSMQAGIAYLRELLARQAPDGPGLDKAARFLNASVQGLAMQMLLARPQWDTPTICHALEEAFEVALHLAQTPQG